MKFDKLKQTELEKKLLNILVDCVIKAKETGDMKYTESWYFMEQVFNANLVSESKEYFLLGQMAEQVHDYGPKAMVNTIEIFAAKKKIGQKEDKFPTLPKKERFLKLYANLPMKVREDIVYVTGDTEDLGVESKQPMTFNACWIEVRNDTPLSERILDALDQLAII